MLQIGINTNNECGTNIDEVCVNVKKAGFNNVMVAFKTGAAEDSIKATLKHGLNIPFVHLTNRYANDLWAKGESNTKYIKNMIDEIKLCNKYGIKIAVLHPTEGGASDLALPVSKQGITSLKKILTAAHKYDVKIALENLDAPNFDHFTYLLDNINDEYLGLCYDAGHHNLYRPDFDILATYGNRILAVHLHDNLMDWTYGYDYTRDLHMLPFDGKLDYKAICSKIAKTGYNNVVMLELHKDSCGKPRLYDDMPIADYLKLAKQRATKLATMIEKAN